MKEEKLNNIQRDYDKEPIIIEDYNPKIMFGSINSLFVVGIIIVFINPMDIPFDGMTGGIIGLFIIYYFMRKNYTKLPKRYIFMNENSIIVKDENKNTLNQIDLNDISSVCKTYQPYYTNNQAIQYFSGFKKWLAYLLSIVLIPLKIIDIFKVTYKKIFFYTRFKSLANFDFFDSIIFNTKQNEIINILIQNRNVYEDIDNYLKSRLSTNIDNLDINLMFFYIDEI